jgi:hypothetical protein
MKEKILEIIYKFSRFAQSELLRGKLAQEIDTLTHEHYMRFCVDMQRAAIERDLVMIDDYLEGIYQDWLTQIK